MILERYISRTNTRINLTKARRENKEKKERKNTSAQTKKSVIAAKTTFGDGVQTRGTTIKIQAHKTSDTILFHVGDDHSTVKHIEIKLQHTRMTNQ